MAARRETRAPTPIDLPAGRRHPETRGADRRLRPLRAALVALGWSLAGCSLIGGFTDEHVAREDDPSAGGSTGSSSGASTGAVPTTTSAGGGAPSSTGTTSGGGEGGDGGGSGGGTTGSTGSGSEGGGGGGGGGCRLGGAVPEPSGRWPDSPTAFCSNGTNALDCPSPDAGDPLSTQDGAVRGVEPAYAPTDDCVSSVDDLITGLRWQVDVPVAELSFRSAIATCAALEPAGAWRVPTVRELTSLWDAGAGDVDPFANLPRLDQTVFPEPIAVYWASSEEGVSSLVRFEEVTRVQPFIDGTSPAVRCVRGANAAVLEVEGAEPTEAVVRDLNAGLMWEVTPSSSTTLPWTAALAVCAASTKGGYDGWRLASIKELASVVDPTVTPIVPADFDWGGLDVWTSTANASEPTGPARVFFYRLSSGTTALADAADGGANRAAVCVRDFD